MTLYPHPLIDGEIIIWIIDNRAEYEATFVGGICVSHQCWLRGRSGDSRSKRPEWRQTYRLHLDSLLASLA